MKKSPLTLARRRGFMDRLVPLWYQKSEVITIGKIEEAIKKINGEVQKNHSNTYLVMVGEHIIDCIVTEEAAEKVLEKGKSLQGCLSHIQTEAAKKKVGQVAVIQSDIV